MSGWAPWCKTGPGSIFVFFASMLISSRSPANPLVMSTASGPRNDASVIGDVGLGPNFMARRLFLLLIFLRRFTKPS